MKNFLKIIFYFFIIFFAACSSNDNKEIREFAKVYYEIIKNDVYNSGNKEVILANRKQILMKYNYNEKKIKQMIENLSQNPHNWQIFENELEKLKQAKN